MPKLVRLFRRKISTLKNPKILIKTILAIVAGVTVFILGAFLVYAKDLPDPNKINSRLVAQSSKILDRNGQLLYEIHGEVKRTLISFEEMPANIKLATIAVEDKDFYSHKGIDLSGIMRAAFKDITRGRTEGGSSITQQLVKNALLSREKTFSRKFKELILTVQIEQRLSKDDILKLYLNEIPYGQNAYGIEAAAQTYFAKTAQNLTLAESAYLAALPQRPSYFNPFGSHREELDLRKNFVLAQMVDLGFVSEEQAEKAKGEEVSFQTSRTAIKAPHFVMYIEELLSEAYGQSALEEEGFRVITTLDYELQKMAEESVSSGMAKIEQFGGSNAGLVAIDPKTGEILAMVGSRDFFDKENQGQVNVTIRELQPGSSFKPYVYATAFKQGMSPATMLIDVKTVFGTTADGSPYAPQNYNGQEHGPVSIRTALAGSLNIPAVKTLALVGVKEAINTAKDMGITSNLSSDVCGLALVLGGCEIKLLDHTSAFATLANEGVKHEPKAIIKIEDGGGQVVFEQDKENNGKKVLDEQIVFLVSDILSDNAARSFIFGERNFLTLPDRPVAAKTGTTQSWRDAWTMGYTPGLAVGVWAGNMDGKLMKAGADGSVVAAPIWNSFMRKAHIGKAVENFNRPGKITEVEVDSVSGLLPARDTPQTKIEKFPSFALPQAYDNVHQRVYINKSNGLLATDQTPSDLIETRTYTVFHSERPENEEWEQPVQTWSQAHGYSYPPTQKDSSGQIITGGSGETASLEIVSPQPGEKILGRTTINVKISNSVDPDEIQVYLRDNQGSSLILVGNQQVNQSSDGRIFELTWQPTPDLLAGNYSLFASIPGDEKSNIVNIAIP